MVAVPNTLPSQPTQPTANNDTRVIGLVGLAHGTSHFFHLIAAPLFPWFKAEFNLSFAQLGALMTTFFIVSGIGQALSGFVVDKIGARKVLFFGLSCFVLAALGLASSQNYAMLLAFCALAGLGNAVFHPVDYSILNSQVSSARLGHAFSVHGITGNLGWASAPVVLATVATFAHWRAALLVAAALAAVVIGILWMNRAVLNNDRLMAKAHDLKQSQQNQTQGNQGSTFGFLALPQVWFSFLFFLATAMALGGIQSFAPQAAAQLHGIDVKIAAGAVTLYMISSAIGMVWGGFLVADQSRADKIIMCSFGVAASIALFIAFSKLPLIALAALIALYGFAAGVSNPSRDVLVKKAAPPNATGRVFGVVYSGLDTGLAISPLLFGALMDRQQPQWVWIGIAAFQVLLIANAFNIGRRVRAVSAARAKAA
jgi:MFS transporter, FSR family, fosmidomycin resistance protein